MSRSEPDPRLPDRRGVAALELAWMAPFLLLLLTVTVDMVSVLRDSLRLERVAGEVCNLLAQYESLRVSGGRDDLTDVFEVAARIGGRLAVTGAGGTVILSGLDNRGDGRGTVVRWQRARGLPGNLSAFGGAGGAAVFRRGVADPALAAGQGAVVVEVYLQRQPWVLSLPVTTLLREHWPTSFTRLWSFSVQRPRLVGILPEPA